MYGDSTAEGLTGTNATGYSVVALNEPALLQDALGIVVETSVLEPRPEMSGVYGPQPRRTRTGKGVTDFCFRISTSAALTLAAEAAVPTWTWEIQR